MFLLPDGNAVFHFVDDVPAGSKGFITMWRTDPDPNGDFTEWQITHTMNATRMSDTELDARFFDDALAFAHRQRFEGFVFETSYFTPLVEITHPPLEGDIATADGVLQ
jgi:hypothetical protein